MPATVLSMPVPTREPDPGRARAATEPERSALRGAIGASTAAIAEVERVGQPLSRLELRELEALEAALQTRLQAMLANPKERLEILTCLKEVREAAAGLKPFLPARTDDRGRYLGGLRGANRGAGSKKKTTGKRRRWRSKLRRG
jgi:hypothetical protein